MRSLLATETAYVLGLVVGVVSLVRAVERLWHLSFRCYITSCWIKRRALMVVTWLRHMMMMMMMMMKHVVQLMMVTCHVHQYKYYFVS